MGLLIRTLLAWLLVLAVPAQGTAATMMAFCGPDHHGGGTAHAQVAALAEHEHDGGAGGAHEQHDMSAQADEDASTSETAATLSKAGHASKQKCSACASCCSLSAIPSVFFSVPAPDLTSTAFSAVAPSVDAFAADGPDRPPRTVLA